MVVYISVLCLLLAFLAFGASFFWPERWNKLVSGGLALWVLSQLIEAVTLVAK